MEQLVRRERSWGIGEILGLVLVVVGKKSELLFWW